MTTIKKRNGYAGRRAAAERAKTDDNAARVAAINNAPFTVLTPVLVCGPYVDGAMFEVHAPGCDHSKRVADRRSFPAATIGDVVRTIYPNINPATWRRVAHHFVVFPCIHLIDNPATPNKKAETTMSIDKPVTDAVHEALNPTPVKRGTKKAAAPIATPNKKADTDMSTTTTPAPAKRTRKAIAAIPAPSAADLRLAEMKRLAEMDGPSTTAIASKRTTKKAPAAETLTFVEGVGTTTPGPVRAAATERKATAKRAAEATKEAAEAKHAEKMETTPAKRTSKKVAAAPAKRARSTRPEADNKTINALTPKLVAADKIADKDKAIAARTKLVDDLLNAGATWTMIADARKVSMSTARGQHRRAGGRMTR